MKKHGWNVFGRLISNEIDLTQMYLSFDCHYHIFFLNILYDYVNDFPMKSRCLDL